MAQKKRYLRIEEVQNSQDILLIDELDRFYARIDSWDFTNFCSGDIDDIRTFDDYDFWLCDVAEIETYKK